MLSIDVFTGERLTIIIYTFLYDFKYNDTHSFILLQLGKKYVKINQTLYIGGNGPVFIVYKVNDVCFVFLFVCFKI